MNFMTLPVEVTFDIFLYLDRTDVGRLRRVSHRWQVLLTDDRLCTEIFLPKMRSPSTSGMWYCEYHKTSEMPVTCNGCHRKMCLSLCVFNERNSRDENNDSEKRRGYICIKCLHDSGNASCQKKWGECYRKKNFEECLVGQCETCKMECVSGRLRRVFINSEDIDQHSVSKQVCYSCYDGMTQCVCMKRDCGCSSEKVFFTKGKKNVYCPRCREHLPQHNLERDVKTLSVDELLILMTEMRENLGNYSFKTIRASLIKLYLYIRKGDKFKHLSKLSSLRNCFTDTCIEKYESLRQSTDEDVDMGHMFLYGHLYSHFYNACLVAWPVNGSEASLSPVFYNTIASELFANLPGLKRLLKAG